MGNQAREADWTHCQSMQCPGYIYQMYSMTPGNSGFGRIIISVKKQGYKL